MVEKWSLFEALREKLLQANQEGAADLVRASSNEEISKNSTPASRKMQSGAELWQLDAELLGLSFDGPNGELNVLGEELWGRSGILPALHCFGARMGGTLRLDHWIKSHMGSIASWDGR